MFTLGLCTHENGCKQLCSHKSLSLTEKQILLHIHQGCRKWFLNNKKIAKYELFLQPLYDAYKNTADQTCCSSFGLLSGKLKLLDIMAGPTNCDLLGAWTYSFRGSRCKWKNKNWTSHNKSSMNLLLDVS